jgi:peptide/nickel transport system substrate-binding protein
VRQAMTYFTNRAQIAKTIFFGLAQVIDGPVYFFRPEYDKNLYSYPYDPQKAMELLTKAGWKDSDGDGVLDKVINGEKVPFRFEFKVPSGSSTGKSILLVLQEELKRHGVFASVRELDWTIFLDDLDNHRFDAATLSWAMPIEEPDDYQLFHSSQAVKRGSNYISYKNPRVDKILEENRQEFDPQKRIKLYKEFQKILNDEQPYTFMFVRKNVSVVQRRFHGVEIYAEGLKPPLWWVLRAQQRYADQPVMP